MSKFRTIRILSENADKYVKKLISAGYSARWCGSGSASVSLQGGCADPMCCHVHEAYYFPLKWGSIETDASGKQAHKIFSEE